MEGLLSVMTRIAIGLTVLVLLASTILGLVDLTRMAIEITGHTLNLGGALAFLKGASF